jgi:hypothetical protein
MMPIFGDPSARDGPRDEALERADGRQRAAQDHAL